MTAADLALTARGNGFVTRESAPVDDHGIPGGVDWFRYTGVGLPTSPQAGTSWGGRGVCTGADNLKISRNKAVSISRDPDDQYRRGWIHIVTL